MRYFTMLLILFTALACICPVTRAEDAGGEWELAKLSYSVDRTGFPDVASHRIIEPKVTNFIALPNIKNAAGYAAGYANGELKIDTDGDGAFDKGSRTSNLFAEYNLTFEDGATEKYAAWIFRYNIEMQDKLDVPLFRWHRACSWKGKVRGEAVEIFDDNSNGLYNDHFEDSIRIGKSIASMPYSCLIVLKGVLYECRIDPHGHTFETRPYSGKTGQVDISGLFANPSKKLPEPQLFFLETRADGKRMGVNVEYGKPGPVPEGKYTLKVAIFTERIFCVQGEHTEFEVTAGQLGAFVWGGAFSLSTNAVSEMGGYDYENDDSAARRGRLKQAPHVHPTIKVPFPVIKGASGEHYVGNPIYSDLESNCFADDIESLRVLIFDSKKKQINKGKDIWKSYNNSAFGFNMGRTFEKYQCPFPEFRGEVTVVVKHSSKLFGDLEYSAPLEVLYSDK